MDFLWGGLVVMALMTFVWAGSLIRRDASLVDRFWGMGFLLVSLFWWFLAGMPSSAAWMLVPVLLWSLRLSAHITYRNWGHGEDSRYTALRQGYSPLVFALRSLPMIFWLQAILLTVIALPLFAAVRGGDPVLVVVVAGVLVWLVGWLYETIADAQLLAFRRDPANRGTVLDTGLWHYSRHPNYFGEILVWIGFGIIALAYGGWWSIPSVLLMIFLIIQVSGVRMLESHLTETRPGYAEYCQRTPALLPRWWAREETD